MPAVPVSEGHHLSEKCNFSIILRPLPTYRWAQVAHWTQELQGLASSPSPGWVPLMLRLSRSGNTFLDSLPLKQTPAQLSCCTPAAPGQSHPTGGCETSLTRLIKPRTRRDRQEFHGGLIQGTDNVIHNQVPRKSRVLLVAVTTLITRGSGGN